MNHSILPGFSSPNHRRSSNGGVELVMIQRPLTRILAFANRTIDDVINDPYARSQVYGYYKLHCWIERETEISNLERQWNSV